LFTLLNYCTYSPISYLLQFVLLNNWLEISELAK
jgi:hypothetical protein